LGTQNLGLESHANSSPHPRGGFPFADQFGGQSLRICLDSIEAVPDPGFPDLNKSSNLMISTSKHESELETSSDSTSKLQAHPNNRIFELEVNAFPS
jgi:hypothetical protein